MTTTGVICKPRSRGKVAVTFWWKQSTATNYTGAHVYASGDAGYYTAGSLTGEQDWQQGAINFVAEPIMWNDLHVPGPDRTNRNGNAAWVDQVTLTNIDHLKPVILAQPPGTLAVPDSYPINLSITVAARIGDMPMTYQWQHSETNLSDNGPFSGTATAPTDDLLPVVHGSRRLQCSVEQPVGCGHQCRMHVTVVPSVPYIDPTRTGGR